MAFDIDIPVVAIAGVTFDVQRFDVVGLDDWRLLAAAGVSPAVVARYSDPQFIDLISGLQGSAAHRIVSRWALLAPEFGWPLSAARCGCLEDDRLSRTAYDLNGRSLFPTPGPVFDHFVVRAESLSIVARSGAGVSADAWLDGVGMDCAWVTAGNVDSESRSTALREALVSRATSWRQDALARAMDVYQYGAIARGAADALREAYVQRIAVEEGFTYGDGGKDFGGVRRRLYSLNSIRMADSVCCTTVERCGNPVFVTGLERVARSLRMAPAQRRPTTAH